VITIIRTDSANSDFNTLVQHLDNELWSRYGEEQSFFDQFNKLNDIKHVVVVYQDDVPMGCGSIKHYMDNVAEVKRMYVAPALRGRGIAMQILSELEQWAKELSFRACILETGIAQPEAIRLYEKAGYIIIPNFGQYVGIESSVCMKKEFIGNETHADVTNIL
jgi:putative acetyltransferase